MDTLPPRTALLSRGFRDGLTEILGANLVGIYLYGAITFPDSREQVQDLDFHVIVRQPFTGRDRQAVDRLCQELAGRFDMDRGDFDGYVIAMADTHGTAPPPTQMWPLWHTPADASWALHCAHIRAGKYIILLGPDPLTIYPQPSWLDLRAALLSEIRFVDEHLLDAPAYCVLNACRILYSFETRDVVISKRHAAEWALDVVSGNRHAAIRAALRIYEGTATAEDEASITSNVVDLVTELWERLAAERAAGRA